MNGKWSKRIKHNLKPTYNFATLGLNITTYNYNNLIGKCNKKIKHSLKPTYKSANWGFNITNATCISKEGLGWRHNNSERAFKTQHPLNDSLAPSHNACQSIYCFMLPLFCKP